MLFIDLVNEEDEQMSPTSIGSLCKLFDLPTPTFFPSSLPPHLESLESPIIDKRYPLDVCPILSPRDDNAYPLDTDLRFAACSPYNPIFDPLPSPAYPSHETTTSYTAQELDDTLLYLPVTPCPISSVQDPVIIELRQRLEHLESRHTTDALVLEGMINTLAVDLVNLTQGINQRLTRISELLQERHRHNVQVHRHTGDILAHLICHPTFNSRLSYDLLGEIQKLRRRTVFE